MASIALKAGEERLQAHVRDIKASPTIQQSLLAIYPVKSNAYGAFVGLINTP
jgi:hypothetical protein